MKKGILIISIVLFFTASQANAAAHAFPVPFVAKQHTSIFFKDLPGAGDIKIFTINGEEVVKLNIAAGQGLLEWNVTNQDGESITSGIYFFQIDSPTEKTTGKIVVIR